MAPGALCPRKMLAMLISSSISGQCTPSGESSVCARCAAVAWARRGYHQSGARKMRPSWRRMLRCASSQVASTGAASSIRDHTGSVSMSCDEARRKPEALVRPKLVNNPNGLFGQFDERKRLAALKK